MELIKENIRVNETVAGAAMQKMVEGDVIVPDAKPDILKVLQVDAVSCITEKDVSNERVSIRGRVDLKVLYLPDSETDIIKSILTSFEFDEDITNKRIDVSDSAAISCSVERVDFNVTNSRKLKLKVLVGFDYEIIRVKPIEIAVDCDEEMEIKRRTAVVRNNIGVEDYPFLVRDRIVVPSGQASICELLKTDYEIKDTEYRCMSGKVMVKGSVGICLLYTDNNGKIEFCEGEFPFTEVFEMDEADEDTTCDIDYQIDEGNVTVEEDTDGDMREVAISMTLTAQVKAGNDIEIDMIEDCFAPFKSTSIESERLILEETVSRPSSQNTIRDIAEIPSKSPDIASVYNVVTKPHISNVLVENGRLICEGKIEACILYLSENADNPVYSVKKDIPFSYSMECNAEGENLIPQIKAEIKHTGYNLNAAGEVEIRCILNINANVIRKRETEVITSVDAEEKNGTRESRIVVYFVRKGDTLWEVAKRYGVPCEAICEFNELADDRLKDGTRLLIPGK